MALIQVRVFEVRIVTTGDAPAPAEIYIDGGAVEGAVEIAAEVEAINPDGGEIAVTVEAAAEINVDVEGIMP
jgi:hypothetical protein